MGSPAPAAAWTVRRFRLRGAIAVPMVVRNTSPWSCQIFPASIRPVSAGHGARSAHSATRVGVSLTAGQRTPRGQPSSRPHVRTIMQARTLASIERRRPEDVGLPRGRRRRTSGLRREEVAALCGMSADYYNRIQQQRWPNPFEQTLTVIARGLHLSLDERDHLFRSPPRRPAAEVPQQPGQPGDEWWARCRRRARSSPRSGASTLSPARTASRSASAP